MTKNKTTLGAKYQIKNNTNPNKKHQNNANRYHTPLPRPRLIVSSPIPLSPKTTTNPLHLTPLPHKPRPNLAILIDKPQPLRIQPSREILKVNRVIHEDFLVPAWSI